jgi:hypothetical protein
LGFVAVLLEQLAGGGEGALGPLVGVAWAAKHPVSRLAGPYGHPLHPIRVTVPIGAWVASFVFDLASHLADEPTVFAKGPSG